MPPIISFLSMAFRAFSASGCAVGRGPSGGALLLRRDSAVDDELRARHEGGLVGGQVQDAVGYVLGVAQPSQRNAGHSRRHQLGVRKGFLC